VCESVCMTWLAYSLTLSLSLSFSLSLTHTHTDMMLGIRTVVGRLEASKWKEFLTLDDFQHTTSLRMPNRGSKSTPAHQMRDFKFKDYAPQVCVCVCECVCETNL